MVGAAVAGLVHFLNGHIGWQSSLLVFPPMARVASEAGTSFDPQIVAILQRRYVELEKMANEHPVQAPPKLSTDIKVERGSAPAAGFAESASPQTVMQQYQNSQ